MIFYATLLFFLSSTNILIYHAYNIAYNLHFLTEIYWSRTWPSAVTEPVPGAWLRGAVGVKRERERVCVMHREMPREKKKKKKKRRKRDRETSTPGRGCRSGWF